MFHLIGLYLKYQTYLAFFCIVVNFLGLNLGIQSFYLDCLAKLFQYIHNNESEFFTKKRKLISKSNEDPETIKCEGYTKREIEQGYSEKDADLWNLLKPTWQPNESEYEYKVNNLGLLLYYCGLTIRLGILLPHRLIIFLMVLICSYGGTSFLELLSIFFPNSPLISVLRGSICRMGFRLNGVSFFLHCTNHVDENKVDQSDFDLGGCGIAIPNHTGPTDIPVLQTYKDFGFMFAMKKGFLINPTYKSLSKVGNFVRCEPTDGSAVIKQRIIERASKKDHNPLVIFAEGTCTSVDSIMMLKKGSFELDCKIWPIAIKYNQLYCQPFWDSRTQSFIGFCFQTLINWSVVADIYHLPPVIRKESESSIEFANRVQGLIANRIGLKQINIDGIKAKQGKLSFNCDN